MVRTRFAPSPTGYLHIGGVRTALFNWLFARRHGGQFILRIDDTDSQRNVAEALAPILDGFRWLGIDWDEGAVIGGEYGPYYQSQRQEMYGVAARVLVERGFAYRDYASAEELQAERTAAEKDKQRFLYSRRFMAETAEQQAAFEAEGRQAVIRLKMPREGECVFEDLIRGKVVVDWAREQDHVIQRADGTCLYNLATVVDDHDMLITHVIRAEEHLSNTPRQIFTAEGLGYDPPQFAHLPYVAEPGSKNKLSKRKLETYLKNPDFAQLYERGNSIAERIGLGGSAETFNPVIVDFYRQVGFLPDALVNYLLLLGWSLDDKTEIFTRYEMISQFSLERVTRAPASFDPKKLVAFQGRYMLALPVEQKVAMVLPFLEKALLVPSPPEAMDEALTERIVRAAGERLEVAGDILAYDDFYVADSELTYEEKGFEKWIRAAPRGVELLQRFRATLATTEPFDAATIEKRFGYFVTSELIKPGEIVQAVRVAVTGKTVGFGLFDVLAITGRERCLVRIDRALQQALQSDPPRLL